MRSVLIDQNHDLTRGGRVTQFFSLSMGQSVLAPEEGKWQWQRHQREQTWVVNMNLDQGMVLSDTTVVRFVLLLRLL